MNPYFGRDFFYQKTMGINTSIYIGPYISAKIETKDVADYYNVNSSGKKFKTNVNFDPNTGEKLELVKATKKEKVIPQVWMDDVDCSDLREDTFFGPEFVNQSKEQKLFILNGNSMSSTLDPEDLFELDLNRSLFQDADTTLVHFRREYSKYIEYYKSKYSIEIKFGMISYAH